MRFLFRHRFGDVRVALSVGRVTDVEGINSDLVGGGHIIMWEFDEEDWTKVHKYLQDIQIRYPLSDIHVAQSHPGGGFHAYCFTRMSWLQSLHIVTGTEGVDEAWINLCAMRNHWTLRLTDKGQGEPLFWCTLTSVNTPNCGMVDLSRHVKYEAHTTKKIWGFGMHQRPTDGPESHGERANRFWRW